MTQDKQMDHLTNARERLRRTVDRLTAEQASRPQSDRLAELYHKLADLFDKLMGRTRL